MTMAADETVELENQKKEGIKLVLKQSIAFLINLSVVAH